MRYVNLGEVNVGAQVAATLVDEVEVNRLYLSSLVKSNFLHARLYTVEKFVYSRVYRNHKETLLVLLLLYEAASNNSIITLFRATAAGTQDALAYFRH